MIPARPNAAWSSIPVRWHVGQTSRPCVKQGPPKAGWRAGFNLRSRLTPPRPTGSRAGRPRFSLSRPARPCTEAAPPRTRPHRLGSKGSATATCSRFGRAWMSGRGRPPSTPRLALVPAAAYRRDCWTATVAGAAATQVVCASDALPWAEYFESLTPPTAGWLSSRPRVGLPDHSRWSPSRPAASWVLPQITPGPPRARQVRRGRAAAVELARPGADVRRVYADVIRPRFGPPLPIFSVLAQLEYSIARDS